MSRRPLPTALKAAAGTLRPCRTNRSEPKAPPGRPEPPTWLSPQGLQVWKRLAARLEALDVLTAADGWALELLVTSYVEFVELEAILAREGSTTLAINRKGQRVARAHPAAAMLRAARRQQVKLLGEFGLTPATRGRPLLLG